MQSFRLLVGGGGWTVPLKWKWRRKWSYSFQTLSSFSTVTCCLFYVNNNCYCGEIVSENSRLRVNQHSQLLLMTERKNFMKSRDADENHVSEADDERRCCIEKRLMWVESSSNWGGIQTKCFCFHCYFYCFLRLLLLLLLILLLLL